MTLGNNFIINPIYLYFLMIFVFIILLIYVSVAKKKKLTTVLLITLLILIIAPVLWIFTKFIPENVSKESMVKSFLKNKDKFITVAEYIVSYGENTHIVNADNSYKIGYFTDNFDSQAKEIQDEEVEKEIEYILESLKYKYIFYSGGCVSFTRTSDHIARSQSIVYTLNESNLKKREDVEIQFIEDDWYYYWGR